MSVKVIIGSTVVTFPTSGTDANWAEPVSEFAVAVEEQLAQVGLPYDVSPQVSPISESSVQNLSNFPGSEVRGFTFNYSTYRVATSPTTSKTENGVVIGVYNETTSSWILQHEFTGDKQANGQSYLNFDMNQDTLQVTPVSIGGTYDPINSSISYSARTVPVSN
jgi:hypothetical protein